MKRLMVLLTVVVLVAGAAIPFYANLSTVDVAAAQEPKEPTKPATETDSFEVPNSTEVTVLVTFVKALRKAQPESGPERDEYDEKAPPAIRKACEQILKLESNEASEAHRLASREMLVFRMEDLVEADGGAREDRQRLTADTHKTLKAGHRSVADAELATTLATTFEDVAPADEAREFYQDLGDMLAHHDSKYVSRRGEFLQGAAKRLSIAGKPFELNGDTIDGKSFDIAAWKGKVVLVEFWATWCAHCLDELPVLKRNYQMYHDRGFEIVGISVDDERSDLASFLRKHKVNWTTLHDEEAGAEHPMAMRYGIAAYPTNFLIGRDGRVVAVDVRGRKLTRKLDELCAAQAQSKVDYPALNISDVVDRLITEGSRLYRAKKTRTDAELRKNLNRQTTKLDLPEPEEDEIPDRELYRRACESVFIVCSLYKVNGTNDWQTSLATAFAVTSDGVLTSSAHVFDNEDKADAVIVMDIHGKVYPVLELLATNQKADTCLFRVDANDLKPLPFADRALPGTRVRVLGHPGDSFYFLSTGIVANYEKDNDGVLWMNTTADFGQGSSGGPVLDEFGNVVGQVSRTYTLYAGGPETRGRPRRVAGAANAAEKRDRDPSEKLEPATDIADPQMVFKSCVPVATMRSLIKPKNDEQPQ
jgi:thiol-disulfide isomerase/thioredoxin